MHSLFPYSSSSPGNSLNELLQAMYASVHDAALAVGIAVHNEMESGFEGMKTGDSHFTDSKCPLQSASARHGSLGWKLLHQLKKVKTALSAGT